MIHYCVDRLTVSVWSVNRLNTLFVRLSGFKSHSSWDKPNIMAFSLYLAEGSFDRSTPAYRVDTSTLFAKYNTSFAD